jgi:type IV secretion system protein VirB9
MRPVFRPLVAILALSVATGAIAQGESSAQESVVLTAIDPMTLDQFAEALGAATGRPVLIGLTPDRAYLRQDRGHRLKVNWTGQLAPLLNGVAPRFGVQWALDGDTIVLFDEVSARPKAPISAPKIRTVELPPSLPATDAPEKFDGAMPAAASIQQVAQTSPSPAMFQPAIFAQPVEPSPQTVAAPIAPQIIFSPSVPIVQAVPNPRPALYQQGLAPLPQQQMAYQQAPASYATPPAAYQPTMAPAPQPAAYRPSRIIAVSSKGRPRQGIVSRADVSAPAPQATNQLSVIRNANMQSTQIPTAGGFVNSTIFYDYMPGAIYELHTSPRFISTIALRPGEKLISKAAGDTVRWVMGETRQGDGANSQTLVFVKPIRPDLRTNIVLTTNERTYMIEAVSHTSDTYTSILSWNYPREQFAEMMAAQEAAAAKEPDEDMGGLSVDRLHFGYKIKSLGRTKPDWTPRHIFDDGLKTYIQFSPGLDAGEAPPLFVLGEAGRAELVNYRMVGHYYVVDRLISAAELRLGDKKQQVVRITRAARGA